MSLKDMERGDPMLEKGETGSEIDPIQNSATEHTPVECNDHQQNELADTASSPPAIIDGWDSDLANPFNWPLWQRAYHVATPGLLGFAVTSGTSMYTPAIKDIMEDLHVSRIVAILGLTLYTLGLGLGPLVTAPLSEGHGRRIVYLVSSPIFMLFTLGAGFSRTFYSLAICRFFAGLSGSPALAVGAGSTADTFPPKQRARATSMFLVAPFAGPALGPVIGGFAAQYKGWRWTQWCLIFITLAVFLIAVPMKETYKPIILKKRAKNLGVQAVPPGAGAPQLKSALYMKVFRPMHMLFTEPTVFFFALYTSFAFGVLFIFFAAFPYIFQRAPYHFSTSQTGLAFISVGVGVLLAAATNLVIDAYLYQPQHAKALAEGRRGADPEHRLYSAMFGSGGIVVGLFWMGWATAKGTHWAVGLAGAIPFAWGNLCLFCSAALYTVDVYGPMNGASAVAANGLSRYTFGAVFPLFTYQVYDAIGIGWATSLLGFLALFMLPILFIFFKYGPAIRAKSRYPKVI